jgi:capsular exopolysaccharide synthesis family protein
MSKFFDGLKKTDGAIARLTIETIGTDSSPSPDPAANGSAPEARVEQQTLHESSDGFDAAEQPAAGKFSYQDAVEGIRSLSDHSNWDDADAPIEAPDDEPPSAQESKLAEIVRTAHGHSTGAANGTLPSSRESEPSEGDSRSVVIRLRAGSPLLPFDTGEAGVAAEEYRRIRTKILQHPKEPRLVLVSSPAPGDGKSVTALNLAGALALNRDARVLLVDMDFRRPTVATLLGIAERDGVAEVLSDSCSLGDAIVRLEPFPNLFLLPAGKDRRNPAELLSSPRWKLLVDEFRSQMTYVVLDGPPVEAVAEYSLLEELTDGLILVVRKGHTIRSLLYRAVESVPKEKILGTVINDYKESFFWRQRSDYYY